MSSGGEGGVTSSNKLACYDPEKNNQEYRSVQKSRVSLEILELVQHNYEGTVMLWKLNPKILTTASTGLQLT